jgi:tetratricopeptide (TPR) repeat protein
MNGTAAETTPLKLYQKAYELHYSERKIVKACDIYEQIIHQFPDSEVSAYASIQLQKIRAGKFAKSGSGQGLSLPVMVLLVVNFAAVIGLAIILSVALVQIKSRHVQARLIDQAIARLYSGRPGEALHVLKQAKILNTEEITPFLVCAEIFRKNNEFAKARQEYDTYARLNPGDSLPEIEIRSINDEESNLVQKTRKALDAEKARARESARLEEDTLADEKEQKEEVLPKRKPKPQPVKQKTKHLIPVDSIAFF